MSKKICGIYCIENLIDSKKYVGLSVNIIHRFYEHRSDLNANKHFNKHLQNAWNVYGKENFKFYVLEECAQDVLSEREKYYIKLFNLNDPDFGYNTNSGGKSTTEEIRALLSNSAKKNIWTDERKASLREKMSGGNNPFYGKHHTDESIQKIIDNRSDMSGENNPMYGKCHTEESKRKMGEKNKGRHPSDKTLAILKSQTREGHPRHRPVYCPELDRTFWGPTEVEQEGITKASYVSAVLIGNQKTAGKHPITGERLHWLDVDKFINNITA